MSNVPSTVIDDIEYDPELRRLRVTFTSGRIYIYEDVPLDVAADFMNADSRGAYFNRRIRNAYACREVR